MSRRVLVDGQEIAQDCIFIAKFLSWARKIQVLLPPFPVLLYRGHANGEEWKLLPTVARCALPAKYLSQLEVQILKDFRRRFDLAERTDLEVLTFARHHGAPTRLLDWSLNPFVSLWFAVSDNTLDGVDGAVFQLDVLHPSGNVCSEITGDLGKTESCKKGKLHHVFDGTPKVERVQRQYGVFSVPSFKDAAILRPLEIVLGIEEKGPLRKIVIPAHLKSPIRSLLTNLGLDAFSMYGGADGFGVYPSFSAIFLTRFRIGREILG